MEFGLGDAIAQLVAARADRTQTPAAYPAPHRFWRRAHPLGDLADCEEALFVQGMQIRRIMQTSTSARHSAEKVRAVVRSSN